MSRTDGGKSFFFSPTDTVIHSFLNYISCRGTVTLSLHRLPFNVICCVHIGYPPLDPPLSPRKEPFAP
jgi:hypothetical protein